MQELLNFLKSLEEFSVVTVLIRMILAMIIGGIIGLERSKHGRSAGMRTHILVCLGATLSALLGIYAVNHGITTDPLRVSAQVVSGIGFLGAGLILIQNKSKIVGLTTAAGLWATAAIGLAVGYGLYEAAIVTVIVVVFAFTLMSRVEFTMHRKRQRVLIYLELDGVACVKEMSETLRMDFGASELQVTPARSGRAEHVGMEALIRVHSKLSPEEKIEKLHQLKHVIFALQIA